MELIREITEPYKITSPDDTKRYLNEFAGEDREFFIVLGLDTGNRVLYREITTIGTLNSCLIHPREVFKNAIIKSVNSIIVAHNHPSGDTEPSQKDKDFFNKLQQAGEILDIEVLDSLIITKDNITSMKMR